ncbi:MAG TPA: PQQ-binding-like beta-propeller repeat protein [Polyangiaceae bacterium]
MNRPPFGSSRFALALAAFGALAGCGGAATATSNAFASDWQNDHGKSIAAVEERLRATPRKPRTPVAVGVDTNGLVGATLPNGRVWRARLAVDSAPVVAGDVIVVRSNKELVGLAAHDGKILWKTKARGAELVGADDDGRFTVISLRSSSGADGALVAVDRAGSTVLELESDEPLGRPAALGGVAFVPWGGQYVSAIGIESNETLGRLLLRDLVSHALDLGTALYFGERALVRFDEKIAFAVTNQANRFEFTPRELPGKPGWLGSGLEPATIDRTARAKIRVYALPEARDGERIGLANGAYAASYFRVVYGLAERDGRLVFADALRGDALGGAAAASGFAFCDASGRVTLYDAKGAAGPALELGARLVACSVEASGLRVPAGASRGSLGEQVEAALRDLDPDMATAEHLLIDELGKLEDPSVTRTLIALAQNVRIPPAERAFAGTLLAKRRTGVEHMLAALERHYDFISGEQPPPLAPLADALGALGEKRAAPLLARHLNDPANGIDDVAHAALALETLATAAELGELKTFFALYRATADEPLLVRAVISVAAAILRVGGADGRALVERAATDPLTQPDVQKGLGEMLAPGERDGEKKSDEKPEQPAPAPEAPSKP